MENIINEMKNNDVIYFSTTTCPPCKITKPVVEKVSNDRNINTRYFTIDQEENGNNIRQEFKVSSVPTIIFLKDGVEVNRSVGLVNEAKFLTLLDSIN